MKYVSAPLGEILEPDIHQVPVEPFESYRMAGVYSFGKGLFARGVITGTETSYKTFNRLREGQFVISRLKAFEGAVGIVMPEFDGWFLSQEFPTFRVNSNGDSGYLAQICRWPTFWDKLAAASKGIGARRERVHPEQLLEVRVPLPDVHEQRLVATKLGRTLSKVDLVRDHYRKSSEINLLALLPHLIQAVLDQESSGTQALAELADFVRDVVKPGDDLGEAEVFIGLEHIEPHTGRAVGSREVGEELGPKNRFEPGDITYPRLRPYQNKVWLADQEGLCSVDQYVLRPLPDINGSLLSTAMRSQSFLAAVADATSNLQLPRIRQHDLAKIRVPIVSREREKVATRRLLELHQAVSELVIERRSATTRVSALELSLLNHAFNGVP